MAHVKTKLCKVSAKNLEPKFCQMHTKSMFPVVTLVFTKREPTILWEIPLTFNVIVFSSEQTAKTLYGRLMNLGLSSIGNISIIEY